MLDYSNNTTIVESDIDSIVRKGASVNYYWFQAQRCKGTEAQRKDLDVQLSRGIAMISYMNFRWRGVRKAKKEGGTKLTPCPGVSRDCLGD